MMPGESKSSNPIVENNSKKQSSVFLMAVFFLVAFIKLDIAWVSLLQWCRCRQLLCQLPYWHLRCSFESSGDGP